MRIALLVFLTPILTMSCAQEQASVKISQESIVADNIGYDAIEMSLPFKIVPPKTVSYATTKANIAQTRQMLFEQFSANTTNLDSISKEFESMLLNNVIPYWYGTPWTFEGHTNTPNDGEIACGYFVSTTLKHLGVNVNRYKLAQQGASNICLSLSTKGDISTFCFITPSSLKAKMLDHFEDGVYVVGLSYHVGFLYLKNQELYFIHSNYMEPAKVVFEIATDSEAFANTDIYVVGKLSRSSKFLESWLSGSAVEIVTH